MGRPALCHARCDRDRRRRFAKDLRIRPAQIMPVEQSQVDKLPGCDLGRAQLQRVGGALAPPRAISPHIGPRGPNQPPRPHRRRSRSLPADPGSSPPICYSRQKLPRLSPVPSKPQKHLVTVRVERRRLHPGLMRQHLQPRNRRHWNPRRLRQSLHRAEPHAHAGKTPRPMDRDDACRAPGSIPASPSKSRHRRHQRRRIAAPGKLDLAQNLAAPPRSTAPAPPTPTARTCRFPARGPLRPLARRLSRQYPLCADRAGGHVLSA